MNTRCPVYHDPQLDLIAALREANALLARDYATSLAKLKDAGDTIRILHREKREDDARYEANLTLFVGERNAIRAELADIRNSYACFVEITLGLAALRGEQTKVEEV